MLAPRQESESAANRHVARVKKPLDDQSALARRPADGQTSRGTDRGTGGGKYIQQAHNLKGIVKDWILGIMTPKNPLKGSIGLTKTTGHPSILQGFTKMTNERIERVQKLFRTDGETVRTIVELFQVKTARS